MSDDASKRTHEAAQHYLEEGAIDYSTPRPKKEAKRVNAFRLSAADSETIDDVAKRLNVSRTTVVEFALHELRAAIAKGNP